MCKGVKLVKLTTTFKMSYTRMHTTDEGNDFERRVTF